MRTRIITITLYSVGLLLLFMHTTIPFLWAVLGVSSSYPLSEGAVLYYLSGFTPIIGAVFMFIAGETSGRKEGNNEPSS